MSTSAPETPAQAPAGPPEPDAATASTGADAPVPQAGKVTTLSVITSTMKAAFGVSDSAARKRDFEHGSIAPFIAAGVIFTVLFVVTVVLVVKLVLPG